MRKRTCEDLGKDRAVAHTDVRGREHNMHGRIFIPGIEEKQRRWQYFVRKGPNFVSYFALKRPIFRYKFRLITKGFVNFAGCETKFEKIPQNSQLLSRSFKKWTHW